MEENSKDLVLIEVLRVIVALVFYSSPLGNEMKARLYLQKTDTDIFNLVPREYLGNVKRIIEDLPNSESRESLLDMMEKFYLLKLKSE